MPPKNIYRSRKVVSCKYCFYEKNDECQLRVCPYVAERITAKVINYEKLILEFFKGNQPRLFSTRLRKHCRTYRHFSYLSTSHRKLFEQTRDEIARITYTPVCGADLAILYLSTSDELMSKHIIAKYNRQGISCKHMGGKASRNASFAVLHCRYLTGTVVLLHNKRL